MILSNNGGVALDEIKIDNCAKNENEDLGNSTPTGIYKLRKNYLFF